MSLLHINYFSRALQKQAGMYVTLPDGKGPFRVIYQLHGLSDDYTIWLRRTSIERYAERYGIMVVMLDGGRSFYTDMASGVGNYERHVLETVAFIDGTFHTLTDASARGIGGLSMGGYGAMKLGLKYPDIFGSLAAHSSVLDIASFVKEYPSRDLQAIFGEEINPAEDCLALAERTSAKPAIYFDCGTDDPLIAQNRLFNARLTQLGIPHTYNEYPGGHNWEYWDAHIEEALQFQVSG